MGNGAPWWVAVSYAAYVLAWCGFIVGGTAYLVFWRDESGWWFALACLLMSPWKPHKWHDLWVPDRERITAEMKEAAKE